MAESVDDLKIRIRELEKEVALWKSKVKDVRYGFKWLDIPEAFDRESENKIPILEEVREKAVDAEGALATTSPHILIEGDNYHALTCLNYTHRGKIDVIYIDPPYNTGSDGFTYKDKRFLTEYPDGQKVPKDHPLRHSYWLSFMEKRLKLAKNLLSEKGAIFISIDDNEQANLKLLCDKIFGEGNFVCNIIWQSTVGSNTGTDIITTTENVLVYSKNRLSCKFDGKQTPDSNFKWSDQFENIRGKYTLDKLDSKRVGIHYSDALNYPLKMPDGKFQWPGGGSEKSKEGWNYLWSKAKVEWGIANDFIVFKKNKNKWNVYNKRYSKVDSSGNQIQRTFPYRNLILSNEFNTAQGTTEISNIFGKRVFDYPKSSKFIQYLLSMKVRTQPSSLILDFFAGSGTTLHATMKLNAEDGGNRQCILIQQAEGKNNICERVTYERNRRVMQGYTNSKGEAIEGFGGHLKYYKTNFVGKHPSERATDADNVELADKAGCLIALAENTLESVNAPESANGFWQIYSNAEAKKHYTCIYHNGDYERVPEFVEAIDALRVVDKKAKFAVYVFSWSSPDFFENEFDDLKNIEIKAIPKPILEIYKALNG